MTGTRRVYISTSPRTAVGRVASDEDRGGGGGGGGGGTALRGTILNYVLIIYLNFGHWVKCALAYASRFDSQCTL